MPSTKPILEVNAAHPLYGGLPTRATRPGSTTGAESSSNQATLAEGGQIEDPAAFVKRLNELMLTLTGAGPSRIWTPGD